VEVDLGLLRDKSTVLREKIKKHPVLQEPVDNLKINERPKICTSGRHTHTHIKKHRVAGHKDLPLHVVFMSGFHFRD
jgi:hypothetical protein